MTKYDYLIVGAGLFGSVFANLMKQRGKKCLLLEKRNHIAGNIYCEKIEGINVHKYGAHIFHTTKKGVWDYLNSFIEFNRFTNSPLAYYEGRLYNLPFNMNTFYQLWGVKSPEEAKAKIRNETSKFSTYSSPKNLEEQALSLAGKDIYEKLIKGYTEKQWGRDAKEIPAFIIKRIPFRYNYDNNYFNDPYQGIPIGGYTKLIEKMLDGIEVRLNVDFLKNKQQYENLAGKIVYTGPIDVFFSSKYGSLEYRSLNFQHDVLDMDNFQRNAVINYTEKHIPYTRIIEHKHFEFGQQPKTVVTKEYPTDWKPGLEPYYPINDEKNQSIYDQYKKLTCQLPNYIFGGRLAEYKYYDMDKVVESAINKANMEISNYD